MIWRKRSFDFWLKRIFAFTLILLTNELSYSQFNILWQKCAGSAQDESAQEIILTNDGGFAIAAHHYFLDSDFSIIKTDSLGNQLWMNSFGGSSSDAVESIIQTSDGGYILVGYTFSDDGDVSGFHGPPWYTDGWIVKTDSVGNFLWQRACGGTNHDQFSSILLEINENFIVAGSTGSSDGDLTGYQPGDGEVWIVRFDSSGNIIQQSLFGGFDFDHALDMIHTNDGGFAISGQTSGSGNDIDTSFGISDVFIAKLDSSLSIQWIEVYGGTQVDSGKDIIQTTDGGFVIAGKTNSNDYYVSGNHGFEDYWVLKTDSLGILQWQKCLGGSNYDYATGVVENLDGNFIVTGSAESINGDISNPIGQGADLWVVCLDSLGNLLWENSIGGGEFDGSNSNIQTIDGKFMIAGATGSRDRDVSGNISSPGYIDVWLVLIDDHPNTVTGLMFADLNSNFIQDTLESPFVVHQVKDINSGYKGYSRSDGFYCLYISGPGTVIAEADSVDYYSSVPLNHSIIFTGNLQTDSLNNFAFQPDGIFDDLSVKVTMINNVRPGFHSIFLLEYTNTGTTTLSGSISITNPSFLNFYAASVVPNQVTTDSLVWLFTDLVPFETSSIHITYLTNASVLIGTNFILVGKINPVIGDFTPNNNIDTSYQTVVGSFDPNDIIVNLDTIASGWNPPYLEYTICFQNTGTTSATFVRVTNPVSSKLDISTFELVSTSHDAFVSFIPHSQNLEFYFDNINLPDSNTNELGSHGFIRYKIKPVFPTIPGDSIPNFGFIYFDFNLPVMTNIAETIVNTTVNTIELVENGEHLLIYPNPTNQKAKLSFSLHDDQGVFQIFDVMGNMVLSDLILPQSREIIIDLQNMQAGIYLCQMKWRDEVKIGKLVKK